MTTDYDCNSHIELMGETSIWRGRLYTFGSPIHIISELTLMGAILMKKLGVWIPSMAVFKFYNIILCLYL